ncbi:MAG: NAD(P)-dependent oxidoreductase [Acidobacteriota bacterium]|nr:NAD(P)-dependent oxidoreductase [Acidobacteriota bacterium]
MTDQEVIGFVGLGRMGEPIARNLLQAGHPLTVWNRTRGKAAALVAAGAREAWDPAETGSSGGIVFTMLSDDRALEQVVESRGFLERLAPGGVHVSMSTVSPETSRRLADRHAGEGSAYVAAPVFGRPEAAAAGKLWVCLSGAASARRRVVPFLRSMSQGLFELGDDPGAANVAKLCGNFLIAAAMEAMSEAFTLGEKNGIDPKTLADLFGQTLFACPIYQNYGKSIAEGRFTPAGFSLPLGLKDMSLVLATATSSKTPMPVASLVRDRLLTGLARGREDHDWSALSLGAREAAGLEVKPEPERTGT